jgi:leucyl-tRNA synthetase
VRDLSYAHASSRRRYYDSFVRWQFQKLRANGDFIAFGKRPSVFSEADDQPCMDHDRDKGEGVGPQEYTALKILVCEPLPAVLAPLKGKKIYCLAATLRPETMCGQTNVWILPEGEYGAFAAADDQVYICAHRAARNMSFQGIFPAWGKAECLLTLKGSSLLGAKVKAPSTPYETVHMLPLTTISMVKGTAIVTSVPSDSPDDYAAFMDLKNPKKREFYGVEARDRLRTECRAI